MLLWRISNHATLDGRGGLIASARWHSAGRRVVYLAETPAGALLEALVHLELMPGRFPSKYKLLKAEAADDVPLQKVGKPELAEDWMKNLVVTRNIGDEWLNARSTTLLLVPSVIVPETFNVLLNPEHSEAARVHVLWHEEYPWDQRLMV